MQNIILGLACNEEKGIALSYNAKFVESRDRDSKLELKRCFLMKWL